MATAPEKIIEKFTATHTGRALLYEMSVQQFHKLEWPFMAKRSNEDAFIFKLEQPNSTEITVDSTPIELHYGRLHSICEKEKNIGFLVYTPKMEHKTYQDCLISAPKNTNVDELQNQADVILTTKDFSVLLLDQTVQYIASKNTNLQQSFS